MKTLVCVNIFFLVLSIQVQAECPDVSTSTIGVYRMWRQDNILGQSTANRYCETTWNAELANFKTNETVELAESLIKDCGDDFYFGLMFDRGAWIWIDDNSVLTADDERWGSGSPGTGDCAVMKSSDNLWYDVPCSSNHGFLCQQTIIGIFTDGDDKVGVEGDKIEMYFSVTSADGPANVAAYRGDTEKVESWSNVESESILNFTIFNARINDSGIYKFVAAHEEYSASAYINVEVHVPVSIPADEDEYVRSPVTRGSSSVTCSSSGIPTPEALWTRNGENVSMISSGSGVYQTLFDTSTAVLYIETAERSDEGPYLCVAKNEVGEDKQLRKATKRAFLSVLGSPSIQNVMVGNCTKNMFLNVSWVPDVQSINSAHIVEAKESGGQSAGTNLIPSSNITISTILTGLYPYIEYNITVTVCPDDCIDALSDQESAMTGIGLPSVVADATVTDNSSDKQTICRVEWSWDDTYPIDIMRFKVQTNRTVRESRNPDETVIDTISSSTSNTTFVFQAAYEPNMAYLFNIYAINCAGESNEVEAEGECTTEFAVPDDVGPVAQKSQNSSGPTHEIRINVPDESNGLISCLFVIVKPGGGKVSAADYAALQEFSATADSDSSDEYMAVAISMQKVYGQDYYDVELGNDDKSSCNAEATASMRAQGDLNAVNKALDKNNYSVYVVYTIPAGDGILTTQSTYSTFVITEPLPEGPTAKALVISLATVGAILFVIFIILMVCFVTSEQKYVTDPETELTTEHPEEPLQPEDPSYNTIRPTNVSNGDGIKPTSATEVAMKNLLELYGKFSKDEGRLFLQEFSELKEATELYRASYTVAIDDQQKKKNRYRNVLPYDHSRVCLTSPDGTESNSYINASYINGYKRQQKFIATQGPLPSTVKDFWKMVLEQRSHIIVMVTNTVDGGKRKCEHYWPDMSSSKVYGNVTVANNREENFGNYIKRTFEISDDQERTHSVIQYQFIDWPDHGVPISTSTFVRFYKACMKQQGQKREPIIVHCSAGAGRTGTFIAYDYLIHEAEDRHRVDPCQCVLKMREDRMDMVQACDQYRFIYRLVVEYHEFKDTDMDPETFYKRPPTESDIHEQFELLEKASRMPAIAKDKTFLSLNVPIMWRPGDGDEIAKFDANKVETYDDHFTLISSAPPTLETAENFWRLILDNDIDIVVSINDSKAKQKTTGNECWPLEQNNGKRVGSISLELQNSEDKKYWEVRTVHVEREATLQTKKVRQYQVTKWTPSVALKVLEDLKISFPVGHRTQRPKVLVYSSNGFGSTGSFCALMNLIARLENERRVDVFRAVKDLRDCRKELVKDISHYKFCVNALKRYGKTTHRISSQIEMHGQENGGYANFPTATSPV